MLIVVACWLSSEVIKCPTIGAASFGQSSHIAHHLPVREVVGHNIDRRINGPGNERGSTLTASCVSLAVCLTTLKETCMKQIWAFNSIICRAVKLQDSLSLQSGTESLP